MWTVDRKNWWQRLWLTNVIWLFRVFYLPLFIFGKFRFSTTFLIGLRQFNNSTILEDVESFCCRHYGQFRLFDTRLEYIGRSSFGWICARLGWIWFKSRVSKSPVFFIVHQIKFSFQTHFYKFWWFFLLQWKNSLSKNVWNVKKYRSTAWIW